MRLFTLAIACKTGTVSATRMAALLLACMTMPAVEPATADDHALALRVSVGNSWQARNDVQIPNTDLGSRFSLDDAVGSSPLPLYRLEGNWQINDRHGVRVLLAPLSYTETVTLDEAVLFAGESFAADEPTEAGYRFNSWRLGYHYLLTDGAAGSFRIGATLKVRDAEIRVAQGATESFDDDIGLVPLLYLAGRYRLGNSWMIGADLDGLAGGPGRAIDLGVALDYSISAHWQMGAELRVLDGGADTDEVYNFARFNSAAIVISTGF